LTEVIKGQALLRPVRYSSSSSQRNGTRSALGDLESEQRLKIQLSVTSEKVSGNVLAFYHGALTSPNSMIDTTEMTHSQRGRKDNACEYNN